LWVYEQAGPFRVARDMTSVLEQTSAWPSFNEAYFQSVRDVTGATAMEQARGWQFSWKYCPRHQIFDRNMSDVVDVQSMYRMIQYNGWTYDALSEIGRYVGGCNGCNPLGTPKFAIASRYDLVPVGADAGNITQSRRAGFTQALPFGAIDTKVTSWKMITRGVGVGAGAEGGAAAAVNVANFAIINGPSTSGGQLKPFSWSSLAGRGVPDSYMRHVGQQDESNWPQVPQASSVANAEAKPASWSVQPGTPLPSAGDTTSDGGKIAGAVIGSLVGVVLIVLVIRKVRQNSGASTGVRYSALEAQPGTYQKL
jgi:hypothetical protein